MDCDARTRDGSCQPDIRAIPGLRGRGASADGRIWSCLRFSAKHQPWSDDGPWRELTPCLLSSRGYLGVSISGKMLRVHRLVLLAWVGPPPEGTEACHNNGIPWDNRVENLRWDTHRRNLHDMVRHGTLSCGERSGKSKLTSAQVAEIRRRRAAGERNVSVAASFGICPEHCSRIHHGRQRRHDGDQQWNVKTLTNRREP